MDGLTLIREARRAGLLITADGNKLVIRGPRRAERVARRLIEHKPAVLAVLRRTIADPVPINEAGSDDATDWHELFEDAAAMRHYCGYYRREVAERLAWGELLERWCELHPILHQPGFCAGCGERLSGEILDLCDGAAVHWERHREFACLIAYGIARKRRAIAALADMGLIPPSGWEV